MTLKEVRFPKSWYAKEGFGTSYTGALTMYDDSVKRKMRISEGFRKLYLKNGQEFTGLAISRGILSWECF